MNSTTYTEMMDKHQNELSSFPVAYAFNEKQIEKALEILNADVSECVTYLGMGDIMRRTDVPAFKEMLVRHKDELLAAMQDEEFAEAAFIYEMDNHEYFVNNDGDINVLSCFYMDDKDLDTLGLRDVYRRARKAHFKNMRDWEV